jgi:peptidyl-Lys metalloendopeptidase
MHLLLVIVALIIQTSVSELTATLRNTNSPTTLSLALQNTYSFPVAILRYNLPLDRFGGEDNFRVILDGQAVQYIGAKVKYADPSHEDYVILNTNETITTPVNLHNLYDFTTPGNYKVQFQYYVVDFVNEDNFYSLPRSRKNFTPSEIVISNPVSITTTVPYPQEQFLTPYPCSSSERNIMLDAATSLRTTMITRAQSVINAGDSPSYREWFGTFTSGRWQIAEEVIRLIQGNNIVAYACDDMANVYAYVYPSDTTHTIYCCSVFWQSDKIGGFDTQAGTLLHELSHFNNIGATDDHTYGTTNCRNLARSNPALAVNNADSFEYFGETQVP